MQNGEKMALTLLAVAETPQFFSGYLPSYFTIATFSQKEGKEWTERNIRIGEVVSATLAIGTGVVIAFLIDDPAPIVGTVIMSALLIAVYEHALRNPAPTGASLTEGGSENGD